ncbi:MAG: hypothetical protein R3D98_06370 [Candidatus Krumholzibacteriia bacterium]
MERPSVDPVGLTTAPPGDVAFSRRPSRLLRLVAAAMVLLFAVTVVTTSVVSMGGYCLTSDGGDTRDLPAR